MAISFDQDVVTAETRLDAPPQRVFDALTDQRQLAQWWNTDEARLKSYELDPQLGGRYRYSSQGNGKSVNGTSDFICLGEITEFDPPRVLAHTWIANWHEDKSQVTLVRYELFPDGDGTRVKVTHSGLAREPIARKDYNGGWVEVLGLLKKFAEGKS
jgi:uncharacterized protein YndB with AHSA1/START domain